MPYITVWFNINKRLQFKKSHNGLNVIMQNRNMSNCENFFLVSIRFFALKGRKLLHTFWSSQQEFFALIFLFLLLEDVVKKVMKLQHDYIQFSITHFADQKKKKKRKNKKKKTDCYFGQCVCGKVKPAEWQLKVVKQVSAAVRLSEELLCGIRKWSIITLVPHPHAVCHITSKR